MGQCDRVRGDPGLLGCLIPNVQLYLDADCAPSVWRRNELDQSLGVVSFSELSAVAYIFGRDTASADK